MELFCPFFMQTSEREKKRHPKTIEKKTQPSNIYVIEILRVTLHLCLCLLLQFPLSPLSPAYGLMTVAGALSSQTVYPSANCCVAFLCLIVQRQKSEKSLNTYSGKVNKGPTNLSTMNRRATAAEEMTPKNWDDLC